MSRATWSAQLLDPPCESNGPHTVKARATSSAPTAITTPAITFMHRTRKSEIKKQLKEIELEIENIMAWKRRLKRMAKKLRSKL